MSGYLLTPKARWDWDAILEFIATDSVDSAFRVRLRFLEVFRFLGENPLAGHFRRDLTTRPLRFFPVSSYLVVYLDETEPVQIIRIFGGTQDVRSILK